jgi:IS5 family transposase
MLGKHKAKTQRELFRSRLSQIIDPSHEMVVLGEQIDWKWIENELKAYYSDQGRPSVPVRTMVGLLLLKQLFDQSDESVLDRWVENPYWQSFTGETYFQHKPPFDPTDFVYFRKRVGEQGMEKVLSLTVKLHKGSESEPTVQIDTTVQEKNITYPTDTKLQKRIIEYLWWIAREERIELRQSYRFVLKKLRLEMHNGHHPRRQKKARRARSKMKTICGRLLREVERKMDTENRNFYQPWLDLYKQVLYQKRNDKNKIYSLHEPQVSCIAKGKAHKKYEFGSKVAIVRTAKSGVIVGMKSFAENVYDGHTLEPALAQSQLIREQIGGNRPKLAVVDRGCKGRKNIEGTEIMIPGVPKKRDSPYEKRKKRKLFRARAGIEPVIGHMKYDHRMGRNFLSGSLGDAVNALLAGAAFNLKMKLNQLKNDLHSIFGLSHRFLQQLLLKWFVASMRLR